MKNLIPCLAALLLVSCGTFEYSVNATEYRPSYVAAVAGKSLAVQPVEVAFAGMRLNLDFRGAVKVNGRDIFGSYLAQDSNSELGAFGVLDTNILQITKLDKAKISADVTRELLSYLQGKADYQVDFFKGFGEGNYGTLSNRKLDVESPKSPQKLKVIGDPIASPYSSVVLAQGAGSANLTLTTRMYLTSEVVEIQTAPEPSPAASFDERDRLPKVGEYWLRIGASIYFKLTDENGKEVATEKSVFEFPIKDFVSINSKLPIERGAGDEMYKYLRTQDFSQYADRAVAGFAATLAPRVSAFYVNTIKMTEVKPAKD